MSAADDFAIFAPAGDTTYHNAPKAFTSSPVVWPLFVSFANV